VTEDRAALTIPEAAAELGIHEKRLRRLLARPEYRDRTQTGTRTTRTGERAVSLVPAALLSEVKTRLAMEQVPASQEAADQGNADNMDADGATGSGDSPKTGTRTRTEAQVQRLAGVYERLMMEKEARIAELSAALEHERGQSRHWQEALAREQVLRALPPPQGGLQPQDGPQAAPGDAQEAPREAETPARAWWMRLWKGRE